MAGKKRKTVKKEKKTKETDSLTAVDKTFYEISITDLNNKLARLRAHNSKIEEQNEELIEKLRKLEDDMVNITTHLNREVSKKSDIIKEMDECLIELSKIRDKENEEANQKLKELNIKYKTMNEQLTSEIKLLNSKLNSLEEFRIQRDELLAKFDEQSSVLENNERIHKQEIKDMELKFILDKGEIKKNTFSYLLQLSNKFNVLTNIRIGDYTQTLYKENKSLENEMEKVFQTQNYITRECEMLHERNKKLENFLKSNESEKERLIRLCESQINIIEELSFKCEKLKDSNAVLKQYKELYYRSLKKDICEEFSHIDMNKKLKIMAKRIQMIKADKVKLIDIHQEHESEILKLRKILRDIKVAVLTAIVKNEIFVENEIEQNIHRKVLVQQLIKIVTNYVENTTDISSSNSFSSAYRQGVIGFTPKSRMTLLELFKKKAHKIATAELMSPKLKLNISSDLIVPSLIINEEKIFDLNSFTLSDNKELLEKITTKIAEHSSNTLSQISSKNIENKNTIDNNFIQELQEDTDADTIQFIY